MGNTDKNKSKKCRRKIRIRLVDPNIPDSYVCEIFDSSLENEEEISKNDNASPETNEDSAKPKNYFEVLMPKKCRKSGDINSTNKNEVISIRSDEESFKEKRQYSWRRKNSLNQFAEVKKEKRKCETESSEDESLLQVQRKSNLENLEQCRVDLTEAEIGIDKDVLAVFSSPKKKLSILNYFSKSGSQADPEKLEKIASVVNSLKTCQTSKCYKPVKKQEPTKTCQTDRKIPLNGINKENVKLAPLFCKKVNKVIDTDRQKARFDFLHKGSPSLFKKMENKNPENIAIFPTVSHVQQRNDSVYWSRREIRLPLPEIRHSEESAFSSLKKFSLQILQESSVRNNAVTSFSVNINKEYIREAKCKYLGLNLDSVIDGLKEKRDKFSARVEEMEKSKIGIKQQGNDETGFEELNVLWSEKYKPKSCEILGNVDVVKKLKKWLESWKSFDEELKVLAKSSRGLKSKKDSEDESENELFDFGSESYGLKSPGNVCIISGPNGCGKTALVYALANELEFSVLELNASSKRTGKKVLSDLQEATQSHKVHRVNLLQTEILQKGVKKKKSKRKKKSKKSEEPFRILEPGSDCKISLILIEDADIVFEEHDEGFFPAISSLVQTSKRPLIFLTNEPSCHYLYGFKTDQCLVLEMEVPSFEKSRAILDIVSLLEGATFDKELLEYLIRQNNFDLRKSLLQLQFWIQSERNLVVLQKEFDLGHLWWGLTKFLFRENIKHFSKPERRKRRRRNDLFDSSDEEIETETKKFKPNPENLVCRPSVAIPKKSNPSMNSYFRVLDSASVLDGFGLTGSQEPVPGFECKPKDSLSLSENMDESPWTKRSLSEQISEEMVALSARIFTGNLNDGNEHRKIHLESPCWEEIRWRTSREKASKELSVLVPLQRGRDKRSLHLDYLPILRSICRAERNRSELNPKRKNRFFHYLSNLGLELTEENLEINCEAFER